jgi:hypothetical protein
VRQDREHRFTCGALDPPDGETTQPDTGIVGVAGQAPALATAGLVEELKAEREEKREHELDKRLGITQELKVRRLVLKIDGDGPVLAYRLGCWSHLSPPVKMVVGVHETPWG